MNLSRPQFECSCQTGTFYLVKFPNPTIYGLACKDEILRTLTLTLTLTLGGWLLQDSYNLCGHG